MPQSVRGGGFCNACVPQRLPHRALNILLIDMVAPPQA